MDRRRDGSHGGRFGVGLAHGRSSVVCRTEAASPILNCPMPPRWRELIEAVRSAGRHHGMHPMRRATRAVVQTWCESATIQGAASFVEAWHWPHNAQALWSTSA